MVNQISDFNLGSTYPKNDIWTSCLQDLSLSLNNVFFMFRSYINICYLNLSIVLYVVTTVYSAKYDSTKRVKYCNLLYIP